MIQSIVYNIVEDGAFAALAAIGFSSISGTPRRAYFACALIAAAGHATRYILMHESLAAMHIITASTIAAMTVGVLAVIFSRSIRCPAEVCFFPALLPMIPGMYAYRTVQALVACLYNTDEEAFVHQLYLLFCNGLDCFFIITGMVVGATLPVFFLGKTAFRATR